MRNRGSSPGLPFQRLLPQHPRVAGDAEGQAAAGALRQQELPHRQQEEPRPPPELHLQAAQAEAAVPVAVAAAEPVLPHHLHRRPFRLSTFGWPAD